MGKGKFRGAGDVSSIQCGKPQIQTRRRLCGDVARPTLVGRATPCAPKPNYNERSRNIETKDMILPLLGERAGVRGIRVPISQQKSAARTSDLRPLASAGARAFICAPSRSGSKRTNAFILTRRSPRTRCDWSSPLERGLQSASLHRPRKIRRLKSALVWSLELGIWNF
jgi:hypothetical protein